VTGCVLITTRGNRSTNCTGESWHTSHSTAMYCTMPFCVLNTMYEMMMRSALF